MGIHKNYVMDIENPHMSYFRKKVNKTLFYDLNENCPPADTNSVRYSKLYCHESERKS